MAQADYFLKLDGIDGESVQKGHEKWIEIQSFSWGMSNSGSAGHGSGGGAGKVSFQDFHFVARTGIQSPTLLTATGTGEHFKKAVLSVRKAGERPLEWIKMQLADVLVSSYQVGATQASDDGLPLDQFSLNFTKVEMEISAPNADGNPAAVSRGGWDLAQAKKP